MSLKLANNQVSIYLKNAQAYLREAHDLCPAKICPEWDSIEKAVKKAEEYVTKIINKFEESLYQPRGSGPSPLLKPCQLNPAAGGNISHKAWNRFLYKCYGIDIILKGG